MNDNKNKLINDGKIKEVLIAKIRPRVIKINKTAFIGFNSFKKNNVVTNEDDIIKKDKIDSLLVRTSYHISSGITNRKIITQSFLVLLCSFFNKKLISISMILNVRKELINAGINGLWPKT